jgi:hypothetical protein
MKDFHRIDWKTYNRPPYYQQWLCKGDTLKLATFGDKGLAEIDEQVLALKDQWDLDNVKGYFLDRIGKLLSEYRNGNTDEYYRILLKLRRILNTNNGSIPSIIKAIKFIYSSEVVHIVPNYPAGLIIEHDGEGTPSLNFNKLLAEIIPAGVSFSTKELFFFPENFPFAELDKKLVKRDDREMFADTVFRNGRVFRDGTTVLDTEVDDLYRNGTVLRDGTVVRDGLYRKPSFGRIRTPIYRSSGIQDFLALNYGDNYDEFWKSNLFRNGAVIRNGTMTRGGKASVSMNDALDFDTVNSVISDTLPIQDRQEKSVIRKDIDTIGCGYNRDGTHLRNGELYRASDQIIDVMEMHTGEPPMSDTNRAILSRNGIIFRDGTYTRSGYADETMIDSLIVGKRFHYFRNGVYTRDGGILRNGDTFIPLG